MSDSLVVLLHLCDSLFPVGSFAHSDGLEAATVSGEIGTPDDLAGWLEITRRETLAGVEALVVARAWTAWRDRDAAALAALDAEAYAFRPSASGREATRAMGSRLLKTWGQIRPEPALGCVSIPSGCTFPTAFGIVASAASVPQGDAVAGFIYARLAAVVSAAMRLMPLGQVEAHRRLARCLEQAASDAHDTIDHPQQPLRSFTPALDIAQMSQQYGFSRLFRS